MEFPHPCGPMQSGGNPGFPLAFEVHTVGRGNLRILSTNPECPVRPSWTTGCKLQERRAPRAPWKPFSLTMWAEGVREKGWSPDKRFKHLQAAFHKKWVSGKARRISVKLCEELLIMSLPPRSSVGSVIL